MMKRIIMLLLACCLLVGAAAAAGGAGTAANPYIIETPAELQSMQNNLAAYYRLANDIDLSGVTWTPIGSESAPFIGSLDGNGYSIHNLNIPSRNKKYAGLFAMASSSASFSDITISDSSVYSSNTHVSLFIGGTKGIVSINNVDIVSSSVSGSQNVGGLVGEFSSYSDVEIINCDIIDCYISSSRSSVGGISGYAYISTYDIQDCSVKNSIISGVSGEVVGGLLGGYGGSTYGDSFISDCLVSDSTVVNNNGGATGIVANALHLTISNSKLESSSIIGTTVVNGITRGEADIQNCDVENTNLYAATIYDIAPSGYDSTSTATEITNVANRYIYASGLSADVTGATVSYTLEGRQGSTTVEAAQGTAQSWAWTFGDGETSTAAEDTSHTYAAPGTYSTSLTLKNYLETTGVTVTTSGYNILPIPPTVSASANDLQLGQSTTLSAVGTLFSTIRWQYSTDSGATWQDISGATANNYVWTPEAGSYQVRVHVTAVGTGYTADSAVLTISVYAPPTISDVSASPTVVTAWPQQITLSATVSDSGPDATTYQWQQQTIGTSTWQDISGATTATYTASQTINSATQYRLIATGTGGQTTSDTVWIYPKSTATVSAATGTPTTSITLSADKTYGATTIQWEYSTNGASTWQDITGATTATYSWTPQNAASYTVRAEVTYGQYTLYSTYAYFAIYNAPSITAVTVSPTIGQYTETITLSAEVSDSGPDATTYQWQQSPQGQNTWTDIPGATTAQWIGQLTFTGATDVRLIATGTGGQTISQTTTYYIALSGEIQSLSATPSVVALPGSTTLSATGSNIVSWEWQELVSGSWVTVGYGASVQESFSAEGTYTYRVLATGADGNTITSESVEVLAGFAPSVSITSPADNVQFPTQSQITVSADITGTDVVYEWDFGSLETINGGNTNPTWVTYLVDGQYTITLRAESIFGSTSDSVTIVSGVMPRPMATDKLDSVSTAPMTAFVESFNVPQGEIIDLPAIFGALTAPMSDLLPDGMFMVIVFGVIFIMLWIMTKNTAVPSIIGFIFGGFILALLPASYYEAAILILAISITGGVIRVFIPPK